MEISERFWSKVDKTDDCWVWRGGLREGYGQFWVSGLGRSVGAHRWAYEAEHGPAVETLDHDCHTRAVEAGACAGGPTCPHRACVRPDHLRPVGRGVNSTLGLGPSGVNARKTHCINGHEFTDENTRLKASGERVCRSCTNARARAYSASEKGKAKMKRQDARRMAERHERRRIARGL